MLRVEVSHQSSIKTFDLDSLSDFYGYNNDEDEKYKNLSSGNKKFEIFSFPCWKNCEGSNQI